MNPARLIGIAGWSGAGKTTLLTRLIPLLVARGQRIATIKHAHHAFDIDTPGKDSYEHRRAGAGEVIVATPRRWVLMHELGDAPEPSLTLLLRHLSPCDLVLVEGYKREPYPKVEVYRAALGKPPLYREDPSIVAVATDGPLPAPHPPTVDLNDITAVLNVVLTHAEPLKATLERL